MGDARIKELVKLRGNVKAKLTLFGNYLKTIDGSQPLTDLQITEIELRLSKTENTFSEFDQLQTEFESLSEEKTKYEEREGFENKYYMLVAQATAMVHHERRVRDEQRDDRRRCTDIPDPHDFVRLPKINLPLFDGDFQHWLEFRDTYLSIIHNNKSLSDINKFHYLRASLKGTASVIVQNIEFRSDNYKIAWNLLTNRYDNERLLVNNHVNALFNLQQAQKESSYFLRNMIDVTNKNLRALASLGQPTDHWDTLVIHIMSKKLDDVSFREWEEYRNTITSYPKLGQYIHFLTNRADLLDTIQQEMSNKQIIQQKQTTINTQIQSKHSSDKTKNVHNIACPMCNKNHYLFSCQEFRNINVNTRIQKMNNFKVCKNCLRPGHSDKQCKLSHCKYCNLKHNTLLHTENQSETATPLTLTSSTDKSETKFSCVLLSTALVRVTDSAGRHRTARVLLDNGSTSHYVTQHLCEELGLTKHVTGSTIVGINNQSSYCAESCDLTIQSNSGGYQATIKCFVLPEITRQLPSSYIDITDLPLPMGIQLADPAFNIPSTVDILLGAEIFWDIITANFIDLGKQQPKLQLTKLGWLVSGVVHTNTTQNSTTQNNTEHSSCYFLQNTDESLLTRFWELESVSSEHSMSQEERACEQHFAKTTQRDDEGRFVVSIPLKDSPEVLGDSYAVAKRRLLSLERRFERDSPLRERYLQFMAEYLSLGHMSENKQTSEQKINYYLPHHGVIRESSTTTKLRVVFDASAVTSSGKSYNNIQMVGPIVQDDLLSILLRFRQHRYVISGDIEKCYRAILVAPTHRHLQQILFRFNPSEPIKSYTLNTVTYGTSSAPYLATKCLVSLAEQCENVDVKNSIHRDFYVDDYISGGDSIDHVIDLAQNVRNTLDSAKFNLRKWQSNNQKILHTINQTQNTNTEYSLEHSTEKPNITEKTLDLNESLPNKTLGLNWNSKSDTLFFTINIQTNKRKVTKRVILSLISQVFDPLGLIGPCTVEAKIMMQGLWLDKCGWDDEVSYDIKTKFLSFIESLSAINSLCIPRWVCSDAIVILELHIFTDASERAYGACVYVRTVNEGGKVTVHLLASKNKVAPLKPVTIPRLELCGALLGTRLCTKVTQSLTKSFDNNCYYWTDSMIVLGWLNTSPSRLKTFVRNRIGEIQNFTSANKWSYVPSKLNPADLVSRGVKADNLTESALWWSGPNFLHLTNIEFPKTPVAHTNTPLPEVTLHLTQTDEADKNIISELIQKKSNYTKLIRSVAYIHRFIKNCRNPSNKTLGILFPTELKAAELVVLRTTQQHMFAEELDLLNSGQTLPKKNRLNSLSPFIDTEGLIRVGGRLSNSHYSFDVKHPILLCAKHHITQILFSKYHKDLLHAGPTMLLSHVRLTYWPLGGRNLARRTVHGCVRCSRFKPKPIQPIMGDLPRDRAQLEFPFLHTGIDYAGPVQIVDRKGRGSRLTKSYICIFVCFAVKALHLELVTDLTKEAFLAALYRFMSRRGKPQTISSDNGTTFVGANNDLIDFFTKYSGDIQSEITNQGINFKFIPPYSPHFGGLWESAVKSVKHHLRRILSLTHLTYEEMSTLLIQIEAILNSRPMIPLSSDPTDLPCLTPAHFLIGRTLLTVPQPPLAEANINRLQRYERIEKLKQHFWQRFSHDYITTLQQKVKWQSSSGDLKLGTMVLVKDKSQPPLLWLMGRILKLYPGPDNINRVADIQTRKGVIQRSYTRICPLPAPSTC